MLILNLSRYKREGTEASLLITSTLLFSIFILMPATSLRTTLVLRSTIFLYSNVTFSAVTPYFLPPVAWSYIFAL